MIKKLFTFVAVVMLLAVTTNAQWTNLGAFPDDTFNGGTHGIAVDPDGKIWVSSYFKDIRWGTPDGDTLDTSGILVFNPDGTQASFSPITNVVSGGGFVVDTLHGNTRGLETDNDGNILYVQSGPAKMIKIDYKTGEGMASNLIPETGSSPTCPAVSEDGTIYVGPVAPGTTTAICTYDGDDLSYLGNAVDGTVGFARTIEVASDGNTIYRMGYSAYNCYVYTRADEFSDFTLTDSILTGMSSEASEWHPTTGHLWLSNDVRGTGGYSHMTWYAYDVDAAAIVDSMKWSDTNSDNGGLPRGMAFNADGSIAYLGSFKTGDARIEKVMAGAIDEIKVTFNCDMSVQIAKQTFDATSGVLRVTGSWVAAAGEGDDWGDGVEMTDPDGDKIYSLTVTFPGTELGNSYNFKFRKDGEWEASDDRPFDLNAANINLPTLFYSNDEVIATTVVNTFIFTADLTDIAGSGAGFFDAATDSVVIMGLDWDGLGTRETHKAYSGMKRDLFAAGVVYRDTIQVRGVEGDSTKWKYKAFPESKFSNSGWESGDDRWITYQGEGTTIDLGTIVPQVTPLGGPLGESQDVLFQMDLNAKIPGNGFDNGSVIPLDEIEYIVIHGSAEELGSWSGAWDLQAVNDGHLKIMYDDGTNGDKVADDNIWSLLVTFADSTNAGVFEYKYGANYTSNPLDNRPFDNEGPNGTNHSYNLQLTSGVVQEKVDEWLTEGSTSIKEIDGTLPTEYALEQNYPNPFNPTTMIRFSIPEANNVTLKIYNMLGQEVAELLSEYKTAGKYEVSFDASKLSSGMYIYAIQTGNFVDTKKMMLIK